MTNRWINQLIKTADRIDIQMPWATRNIGLVGSVPRQERVVSKGKTDAE